MVSPGYPYRYQNEEECIYTISVPGDNIIKIIFSEFNLEYHPNCTKDFLEIADGGSEFSDSLGKFCGNEDNVQQILFFKQNNYVNKENMPKILYSTQSKMSPLYTFWPPWLFDGLVQEASPFLLSSSLAYLNCKRGLLMRNLARLLLFPNIPLRMLLQVSVKVEFTKL